MRGVGSRPRPPQTVSFLRCGWLTPAPMASFEYLLVLALCLLVTAPLELVLGVRVYRQARRLALTLLCTGAVFVTWDLVGAGLGHWEYVVGRVLPVRLLGLPLEEYLFFVVVPLCGVLAFEAVRVTLDRRQRP
jgi:lycopene cyclase domain-containing protein